MADLGNISKFLKEGSVANLDWLDVNEKEYRAESVVPKQNLDIAPDLEALWAREGEPSTLYAVPNKQQVPPFKGSGDVHTMGDLSEVHGKLRSHAEDIAKTTRLAMIQSKDPSNVKRVLSGKFDLATLQANRDVIASVLQERGLVGGIYVQASDFPNCAQSPKISTEFVRKYASDAKYVLAKSDCNGCIHAKVVGSKTNCAVFHKQIVPNVPYTEQLANEVISQQQLRGKTVQASEGTPKERIKTALLTGSAPRNGSVYSGVGENQLPKAVKMTASDAPPGERLIQASSLTRKRDEKVQLELKSRPIVAFIQRELLKGRTAAELASSLKTVFSVGALSETRPVWEPHFKEAGLYGTIYSTQESFPDSCHEGADFLAKHNPGVRSMVAGAKCNGCIYNKVSRCMLYGKPLVKEASDLYTWDTVEAVLMEHRNAGRLPAYEKTASLDSKDPRSALKEIHTKVASLRGNVNSGVSGRMDLFTQWAGGGNQGHAKNSSVTKEIVKTASKYMNEGLYGKDLLGLLKSKYEVRDLKASQQELKTVLAEQGLQGIYYINPTVYKDYGHGCEEVSRLFRAKQVPYVKMGNKCGSCVHNVNGNCSKLNKPVVAEPPYLDKKAQQRAILASGASTEVTANSLLAPTAVPMLVEYQLQNHGMADVELNLPVKTASSGIVLGRNKVKV